VIAGQPGRISATTRVAVAVKASTLPKAAMSMAATNWPVLAGVMASAVKSTARAPEDAPFGTPASRPMAVAGP